MAPPPSLVPSPRSVKGSKKGTNKYWVESLQVKDDNQKKKKKESPEKEHFISV